MNKITWRMLSPVYWPTWLAIGIGWLISRLPYSAQMSIGRGLGTLVRWTMPKRRKIVQKNLALCFPELTENEREQLLIDNFHALGMGGMEMIIAWWGSDKKIAQLEEFAGLEHITEAEKDHRGVLLLSAHLTTLELGARILTRYYPAQALYKPVKNPVFEWCMYRARHRYSNNPPIKKYETRTLVRALRQGANIWYAPDQHNRAEGAVVAPFFGLPALTTAGTSRLAQLGRAHVVPCFTYRMPNGKYRISFYPPLKDFPSGDDTADTARINKIIEDAIRRAPEQYWWIHRRFKGSLTPDPYADL